MVVTVNATEAISSQNKVSHTAVIQGNANSSSEPGIKGASQIAVSLTTANAVLASAVIMNYTSDFGKKKKCGVENNDIILSASRGVYLDNALVHASLAIISFAFGSLCC